MNTREALRALVDRLVGDTTRAPSPDDDTQEPVEVFPGIFAADLSGARSHSADGYAVLSLSRVGDAFKELIIDFYLQGRLGLRIFKGSQQL